MLSCDINIKYMALICFCSIDFVAVTTMSTTNVWPHHLYLTLSLEGTDTVFGKLGVLLDGVRLVPGDFGVSQLGRLALDGVPLKKIIKKSGNNLKVNTWM